MRADIPPMRVPPTILLQQCAFFSSGRETETSEIYWVLRTTNEFRSFPLVSVFLFAVT